MDTIRVRLGRLAGLLAAAATVTPRSPWCKPG